MTDAVEIALIGSVTTIIINLFIAYVSLKTHTVLKVVQSQTNGISTKLLTAEKGLSYQEGMASQRKEDKENPS